MPKPFDVVDMLSSAAMVSRKAATYAPETHVVNQEELRQIIWELQEKASERRVENTERLSTAALKPSLAKDRRYTHRPPDRQSK